MALRAGTVDRFEGSLGELIDRAFAAELFAEQEKELPETGADERRVLFAAIAQGVLAYLAANETEIAVVPTGASSFTARVEVRAPRLSFSVGSTAVAVSVERFPANTDVTVAWELPHADERTVRTSSSGVAGATLPRGGRSGRQAVSARDANGNQAVGGVTL